MKVRKALVAFGSAVLFLLAGCGSSSGGDTQADCGKLCQKVGECGTEQDLQDCEKDCPDIAAVLTTDAWNYAVDCIMNSECGPQLDPNRCLQEAASQQSPDRLDPYGQALCTKASECDPSVDVTTCVSEFKSDTDLQILLIIKDELLGCTTDCVVGKTCEQIGTNIDAVFVDCACGCDLQFFCEMSN